MFEPRSRLLVRLASDALGAQPFHARMSAIRSRIACFLSHPQNVRKIGRVGSVTAVVLVRCALFSTCADCYDHTSALFLRSWVKRLLAAHSRFPISLSVSNCLHYAYCCLSPFPHAVF
jgi:hypothetical protein